MAALVALGGCGPGSAAGTAGSGSTALTAEPSQPDPDPERSSLRPPVEGSMAVGDSRSAASDIDVFVVGDSLTVSATDEIRAALSAAGVRLVGVEAVEGRRMTTDLDGRPSGLTAIDELGAKIDTDRIDIWVIALGTNDVGAQATSEQLADDIDATLGKFARNRPVVWIDVFIESRSEDSAAFGALIRESAIERGNMVVADWFHPAQRDGALVSDGVHLTSEGRNEFANTIADGVRRLVPAPSVPDS